MNKHTPNMYIWLSQITEIQMDNKQMKIVHSLIIRKMQIKITTEYYFCVNN